MWLLAIKSMLADRGKLLTSLLGVVFSVVLINLQGGLLLGLIQKASLLVDYGQADIWVGHRHMNNVDIGTFIPERWVHRIRGTLLADLNNDSRKHQVAQSVAEVAVARAQLERLRNGERAEKRRALAAVEEARRAQFQQTEANWGHSQKLFERRSVSQEERDRDYLAMVRAQAELDEATAERAIVEAPARADEVAEAEGRVAAAEAKLRLAEAELAKTRLLAPFDGRVLQVHAEPGELAGPGAAPPVLLLADASRRRVRAFVEELDTARVRVGQPAVAIADGLPGQEFRGKVGMVAPRMGKRDLLSDAPGEYKDLYFREVVIDLDAGTELPLNLRVQARIQVAPAGEAR
jgi:multidrug efflux pump subunit AcrA (membrane-fusion protein)